MMITVRLRALDVLQGSVAILLALIVLWGPLPAHAGWLGDMLASTVATSSMTTNRRGIADATTAIRKQRLLPEDGVPLAAHASAEGHWTFTNRSGETFTAGTPDELKRVVQVLAPDAAAAGGKLVLVLTEDSVFDRRVFVKDLPKAVASYVVIDGAVFRVERRTVNGEDRLFAVVRPNLSMELTEQELFDEGIWRLSRPLGGGVRVLSLEPGGPQTLPAMVKPEAGRTRPQAEAIDPFKLPAALSALRGQTALITARIDRQFLAFRSSSGGEQTILYGDVTTAAAGADVDLVLLSSATPLQPGKRNWLWQRIDVDGLNQALAHATLSDFLNALGAGRGHMTVSASRPSANRVVLRATPAGAPALPLTGALGDWLKELTANVTGNVAADAIEVHVSSRQRSIELSRRLLPWLPSVVQLGYLAALIAGVLGIRTSWRWWHRVWPPERRADYAGTAGFAAAQVVKALAFLLVFLPLAGLPAFLWSLVRTITGTLLRQHRPQPAASR